MNAPATVSPRKPTISFLSIARFALGGLSVAVLLWTVGYYFTIQSAVVTLLLIIATSLRPSLGVALLIGLVSFHSAKPVYGGIVVNLSELEFGACAVVWLTRSAGREPIDWRPLKWGAPFLVAIALSAVVNNEWFRVVPHILRSGSLVGALFLAANGLAGDRNRTSFRSAVAVAGLFFVAAGLSQFPTAPGGRVSSFFASPNQFAGYLNLLLPVMLATLLSAKDKRSRTLWGLLTAMALAAGLATQSRAGLAAGLVACVLVALLGRARNRVRPPRTPGPGYRTPLLVAVGVLFGLIASAGLFGPSCKKALESFERRQAGFERLGYYRFGWEIFRNHPLLGVGPGNYQALARQRQDRARSSKQTVPRRLTTHVHSLYLQLCVDFGLAGLTGFLFLIGCLARAFLKSWKQSIWGVAGLGVLTAFVLHNLLDVTIPSLGLETGLVLGALCLASASSRLGGPDSPSLTDQRPAWRMT